MFRRTFARQRQKLQRTFTPYNRIEVSRAALLHNLQLFGRLSGLQVMPVLKSNAYGHGIEQVAEALRGQNVPYIAVDDYLEALRIRAVSRQPVLVMGAMRPENFARLAYKQFAFVVRDEAAIRALGATNRRIKIHLECNTGMNRHGAKLLQLPALVRLLQSYKNLELEGVMTHLADADGTDPRTVEQAAAHFDICVQAVRAAGAAPQLIHIAQTAGSVRARSKYANAVRLGIGLYGINPFGAQHPQHGLLHNLRPALRLVSGVSEIVELAKGDKVGYNYTFTAPKPMRVGVLPAGYYQGVNRALSNAGTVLVRGRPANIVGRVCMNHTMIALPIDVDVGVGDDAVIYSNNPGDPNAIDTIAAGHQLFSYNLLSALGPDVRRILVD